MVHGTTMMNYSLQRNNKNDDCRRRSSSSSRRGSNSGNTINSSPSSSVSSWWWWSSSSSSSAVAVLVVVILWIVAVVVVVVAVRTTTGSTTTIATIYQNIGNVINISRIVYNGGMKLATSTTTTTTTTTGVATTVTTTTKRRRRRKNNQGKRKENTRTAAEAEAGGSFCGTYRGYPYVGFRCRSVDSPVMGLMWYSPSTTATTTRTTTTPASSSLSSRLRHEANHDDGLTKFGWNEHDGRRYGTQLLSDPDNNVNLTVQWIRLNKEIDDEEEEKEIQEDDEEETTSSTIEGHWVVRVSGDVYHRSSSSASFNDDTTTTDRNKSNNCKGSSFNSDTRNDYCSGQQQNNNTDLSLIWYVATPLSSLPATYNIINETIHIGNFFRSWMDGSGSSSNGINNTHPTYSDDGDEDQILRQHQQHYNETYFAAFQTNPGSYFDVKSTVVQELRNPTSSLPPHLFDPTSLYRAETITTGNQVAIQSFFQTPFQIDYHFQFISSTSSSPSSGSSSGSSESSRSSSIEIEIEIEGPKNNRTNVSDALVQASDDFRQKFNDIFVSDDAMNFRTRKRRNRNATTSYKWSDRELDTGYYALSNLLSSITYMYGDQQIYDTQTDRVIVPNDMKDLVGVMVVPDRPDHAQGFLWDDGFHQQLLRHWDVQWSIKILKSWYEKTFLRPPGGGEDNHDNVSVNVNDGWIPRQQIIGDEARWSARPTSWAQIQGTANPPTHHWVLESLLQSTANESLVDDFLNDISSSFERNLKFYVRTQASSIPGFFAWKGKTRDFCLPSGMDDYPRSKTDDGNHEAHLDLHTWLIVSCRVATKVFKRLNDTDKARYYEDMRSNLTQTLFTHFWDKSRNVFDDWYYITSESDNTTQKVFSGHIGYLNWFPVFLEVLPTDTPIFGKAIWSLLDKKNGVWAKYGLRSLSINDPSFGVTAKYWTGPVWLNINYLAVSSLYNYHQDSSLPMPAPVREKIRVGYHELRQSLVNMVVDSYTKTGFIWETYNGTDGRGLNNHPFTGWSALIVNIMAELY